ncbi:hypothetical protein BgAZ_101970 [Babesia gibsoni]|uniref:Uncharacterized protein n=1 Tax=Babesia gibsoni TaxID=33632 RepID=A0AAD8PF93_BABGI|nr:hypothetical protein BgAZ_101970 [Babesia gibsoni]
MCVLYIRALACIWSFWLVFEPIFCYRQCANNADTFRWILDGRLQSSSHYQRIVSKRNRFCLLADSQDDKGAPEAEDQNNDLEDDPIECDNVIDERPVDDNKELSLEEFKEAVSKDGFDEKLSDIVMSGPDMIKEHKSTFPFREDTWFNNDEAIDSEDELLAREYCSERVPNMDDIYKRLDPHGVRKYAPSKLTAAQKALGRVYGVNQSLIKEEDIDENRNTYTLPEDFSLFKDGGASAIPTDEAAIDKESDVDNTYSPDADNDDAGQISQNSANEDEACSSDDEMECPEPYIQDPNADDHDDTVIEDDAYRYFLTLPMLSWTTSEKEALVKAQNKIRSYSKHSKEKPRQPGTSSPYDVFSSDACSNVGITDGECKMSLAEEVSAMDSLNIETVELDIEEYKHSDLLNDIDDYEAAEYPPIAEHICAIDADSAVFTMNEFVPSYSEIDVVDPRVYVSVPKSSIKLDETGTSVLNEQFLVKRERGKRLSSKVSEIHISDQPQVGTILIPNELGYLDQNIRYMADEIAVMSRSLVFVPDIHSNDLMFAMTMNRLIKLIQMAFNVDRIAFVALGSQGNRVIHYTYTAMRDTVNRTLNDFRPVPPKLDPDRYCRLSNINRLENILSRQSTSMLEDIIQGIQRIENESSIRAAEKTRDYNIVKPLCNLLQSIVLWDSVDVNFKEVAELGVPILFNMSNRNNIFDGLLRLDDPKFLSKKEKCTTDTPPFYLEVFDFMKGKAPADLQEVMGEHVRLRYRGRDRKSNDTPDMYHISTNHTGIDVWMNFFPWASRHFYMKKPGASDEELKAIGNAIMSCADWINSWSF